MSIAKAGIIAVLNARTSVLASANPVGSRYNPAMSVVDNIDLPPTLLSRFDLIYLVLDKPNPETDRRLARHLVALHYENPPAKYVLGSSFPNPADDCFISQLVTVVHTSRYTRLTLCFTYRKGYRRARRGDVDGLHLLRQKNVHPDFER